MSIFDGFTPTYTFRLQIERIDRMILDTEITAKGTPDEIAKAKKNVQRLLTEYTPDIKAPDPAQQPEVPAPALPEPEGQDADRQQGNPPEAAAPPRAPPRRSAGSLTGQGDCSASAALSAATPSAPSCGSTRPRWPVSAATI